MPIKLSKSEPESVRQADAGRFTIVWIPGSEVFRVYDGSRFRGWFGIGRRINWFDQGLLGKALREVGALAEPSKTPTEPAPREDEDTAPIKPKPKRKATKKSK